MGKKIAFMIIKIIKSAISNRSKANNWQLIYFSWMITKLIDKQ